MGEKEPQATITRGGFGLFKSISFNFLMFKVEFIKMDKAKDFDSLFF